MNEALRDAFRHNTWATRQVIAACRALSHDQLTSPAAASFGSPLATLNHIILSDASYARRLTGRAPSWLADRAESVSLDELAARVEETERLWDQFLAEPIDAERLIILDDGAYEAHAGVLIAQALYHGSAHREQICTILTGFGFEPPDIQAWAYGEATGRGRERRASAG